MKRIKFMIPYIIISIILIIGMILNVYADYLYSSNDVYYENNSSTLTSNNVQSAIEELDTKCENRIAASQQCPEGYKCTEIPKLCKRATTLHTETCTNTETSGYCRADGYAANGTITYGNLGTVGSEPSPGDAFDCDVNGDGTYDAETERFYYVSKYYDTSTKSFDDDYYTFIYYSNTTSGVASTSNVAWYSSSNSTSYGPTTAMAQLPKTTGTNAWRDDLLKTRTRNILGGSSGSSLTTTYKSNFSYEGYAARLLTAQELQQGCNITIGNSRDGELSTKCKYLMERTKYSTSSYATYGPWLESAYSSTEAWFVISIYRRVGHVDYPSSSSSYGARPAIEVLKSNVSY